MTGILNALIAGVSGAVKDVYFNLVSLLLPGNGTNGAQNNTFLDSSTNNFTITRNGNTTQGTFSPFSQTGWGAYFDGSNDNVSFASGSQVIPATGDFTIEAWIYPTSVAAGVSNVIYAQTNSSGASAGRTQFLTDGATIAFQCAGTYLNSTSGTLVANTWNYVAATRTGSSVSLYVNGSATTGLTASGSIDSGTYTTAIGVNWVPQYFTGYISNFRVSTVVRSGLTTVPTSSFTNDANTRVLTLQNNRFIDNSSSPFTLTANNGVAITPFSPFAPTAAYTTAAVGGSGYFDGNGDYLQTPNNTAFNLSSGSFTIEAWVYRTNPTTSDYVFWSGTATGSNSGLNFYISGGNLLYIDNGVTGTTGYGSVTGNQWIHVALIRDGGDSYLYVNGVCANPSTPVTQAISTGGIGLIGCAGITTQGNFDGYISNFRIIKGQALVTGGANFTPPTGPVNATQVGWNGSTTALTGTCSILLNYTNAGITDATAKNDLETVGNAQISTTQSKWGGGSMYFDGTGDYLNTLSTWAISGSEAYTLEAWIYPTTVSGDLCIYETRSSSGTGFVLFINSTGKLQVYDSTGLLQTASTTTLTANTWTYIAMVRSAGSSTNTFYVNGTSAGTFTLASFAAATNLRIGARYDGVAAYNGYMQDFRITKGYARTITASPTAPFPVQ